MSKKVKLIMVAILLLGIAYIVYGIIHFNDIYDTLTNGIANSENDSVISLKDYTKFKWDEAYIFKDPYISGEGIDRMVGFKTGLKRNNSDFHRRIVFIRNNKVVYDYTYMISRIEFKSSIIIDYKDTFKVKKKGKLVQLIRIHKP